MSHIHQFTPSKYPDYNECLDCHSLHRIAHQPLSEMYEGGIYWDGHIKPTIYDQQYNVDKHRENGLTKNEYVLQRIPPRNDTVIEIACAPGNLMNALLREKYAEKVIGFEVDATYEKDIRGIAGYPVELIFGYFPESSRKLEDGIADTIIALDFLEHTPNPYEAIRECHRLLNHNGILLLMLPLAENDGTVSCERMIHPEHLWLLSKRHMVEMLADEGFKDIGLSAWTSGHDVVTGRKE